MKYLIVDACLNGTGIRDKYNGGYIDPQDLGLSSILIRNLNEWLLKYGNEHYYGFVNEHLTENLDKEGKEIASIIKSELGNVKIEYFSDARSSIAII